MTKAYDKIAEGVPDAQSRKARTVAWPRHSRFLGWSSVRARLGHVRAAGAYGPVFFRAPLVFSPLAEQMASRRTRARRRKVLVSL
ncbi:MAG: hypothetical protein ACREFP_11830 [Acetobacteraceae bacterium]